LLAGRSRSSFATDLYSLVRGVVADSLAASTRRVYRSHVAFFHEFMTILGLDISSFGLPVAQGGFTLKEEETLLSMFAVSSATLERALARSVLASRRLHV